MNKGTNTRRGKFFLLKRDKSDDTIKEKVYEPDEAENKELIVSLNDLTAATTHQIIKVQGNVKQKDIIILIE